MRLVYGQGTRTTRSEATPADDRARFCLADDDVLTLARWACLIENHYSALAGHAMPMDIEWAKDGISGDLFIVQARPETVHSAKPLTAAASVYRLKETPGKIVISGQAVGERIGSGRARVVTDIAQLASVQDGEVLIAPSGWPRSWRGLRRPLHVPHRRRRVRARVVAHRRYPAAGWEFSTRQPYPDARRLLMPA